MAMAKRHSLALLLVASLVPVAASASHWLVMDPVEVIQRFVDGTRRVEVRATKRLGNKLLSSLVIRVNGREVKAPAAVLARLEWPNLTTMQLLRASEGDGLRFISIECRCGNPDGDEPSTAVIAFKGYRYESISIQPAGK